MQLHENELLSTVANRKLVRAINFSRTSKRVVG